MAEKKETVGPCGDYHEDLGVEGQCARCGYGVEEHASLICDHCGEVIEPGQRANVNGVNWHGECSVRSIVGSLAHQMRVCSCFVPGSQHSDPPFMSLRHAAKLAEMFWRFRYEDKKAREASFWKDAPNNCNLHPPDP
jgi:hypothetical protein